MMNKAYYRTLAENLYDELKAAYIKENNGVDDGAFDFGQALESYPVTDEIIVGYYLVSYGDDALEAWEENIRDTSISFPTDASVTKILKGLFL